MEQPPRSNGHIHTQTHPCLWLIQLYVPNTFRKIAWVFHVPQESVKSCESEPTVFRWKSPTEISFSSVLKKKGYFCMARHRRQCWLIPRQCDLFLDFFILSLLIEPAVILRCTGIWKRVLLLAHHLRAISLSSRLIRFPFRKYVFRR